DIVIDPQAYMPMIQFGKKVMQGSPIYPVLQYDYHQIVNDISRQNLICVFISARSISRADDMPQNYIYNTLFNTTEAGWGETDFTDSRPRFDKKKDIPGPVYSGAVVQFKTGAKTGNVKPAEGRVAVFGDSDFICNGIADGPGHKDLFANTIQWLLDQERDITIRPKKAEEAELFLSAAEQLMMQLVFIILLPLAIAGSGIAVFMHRRKIN
ncbi:MAG TPA: hypothetical protein DC049_16540, partial [Spirochaetia bacterium]|nr:hypothetical protein [Spirochaetia bacterium]